MFKEKHHVIFLPGLHDQHCFNKKIAGLLPRFWDDRGFPLHVVEPHWEEGESFQQKLEIVVAKVDEFTAENKKTSIMGYSAGVCLAFSSYAVRRNDLIAGIGVMGRVAEGNDVSPSLAKAAKSSPAFRNGVLQFEKYYEPTLYPNDRKKLLTIRALWDEAVPPSTVHLKGGENLLAPMIEHIFGGLFVLTFYAQVLQKFLEKTDKNFSRSKSYSLNRFYKK